MNRISKLAIALAASATCAMAMAEPYDAADQARRDRNAAEVMHKHHLDMDAQPVSASNHETIGERTDNAIDKTKAFTHRQAQKMRHFGERQNRKYGKMDAPKQTTPYNNGPN